MFFYECFLKYYYNSVKKMFLNVFYLRINVLTSMVLTSLESSWSPLHTIYQVTSYMRPLA